MLCACVYFVTDMVHLPSCDVFVQTVTCTVTAEQYWLQTIHQSYSVLLKVSFETVCNAEPPESNLSVFCLLLLRVNCVSISMHEVQWRHWMEHKSILEVYIMWTGRERVKLQKLEILKPKLSVDCIFLYWCIFEQQFANTM